MVSRETHLFSAQCAGVRGLEPKYPTHLSLENHTDKPGPLQSLGTWPDCILASVPIVFSPPYGVLSRSQLRFRLGGTQIQDILDLWVPPPFPLAHGPSSFLWP